MPAILDRVLHKQHLSGDNPFMRGSDPGLNDTQTDLCDHTTRHGTLTVICGCMFSGKTTELLRRLRDLPPSSTLVFKHMIDRRYLADAIVTHNGKARSAVPIASVDKIESHLEIFIRFTWKTYHNIARDGNVWIDSPQFVN